MKFLFFALNGSFSHSNLAVRCLSDALADAGFCDLHRIERTLRDRTDTTLALLVSAKADVYAFSCYIWNIDRMIALARDLKAILPRARVLFGGPECSFDTDRFTALPFVDTVITGEGEEAIVALADRLSRGEAPPKLLHGTPDQRFVQKGIHYKQGEPISSLVYYESSRGCPYSCAFCLSSTTEGVRAKSAEKTLADLLEFEAFSQDFTVKLVDRTFNFDRARAKAIWQGLLDPRYTKQYHFEVCASLLDEESFEILSRFPKGKVRLEIGLQSIHEKTLRAVSRHTDANAVLAACRRLHACGNLHLHLDLIAGLPYESLADLAASFDAAYPVCDVLQLGFLKLLHGTALRESAEDFGIVFSQEPPYTVLKTDSISFEELALLHRIDDLVDRVSGSGRFARTLAFLIPRIPSAFAFFKGLSDYICANDARELQKIAQRQLFVLIAEYGKTLLATDLHAPFLAQMREDYAACEIRRPPFALRDTGGRT